MPEVLGCENRGYGPAKSGTDVEFVADESHPILKGIARSPWHGAGSLYRVNPLGDKNASVLLQGKAGGRTEPIAWTRTYGKSRIFYTSLGHQDDFPTSQFRTLLANGICWALEDLRRESSEPAGEPQADKK